MDRPRRKVCLPEKLRLDFDLENGRRVSNAQDGAERDSAAGDGVQIDELSDDVETADQYTVDDVEVDDVTSDDETASQYGDEGVDASDDPVNAEEVPTTGLGLGEMPAQNTGRNRVKWGDLSGLEDVAAVIEDIHARITTWRANCFEVPRSQAGKDFVKEATRLLKLFNTRTRWEPLAINILLIFFPMMLQKPSARSKSKDHSRYLLKRLQWWNEGCLEEIMSEAEEIQRRMATTSKKRKEEAKGRGFSRLMMEGKVKQALRLVDADNTIDGVHVIDEEIRATLEAKHPEAVPADDDVLIEGEVPRVEEVIYEEIDAHFIQSAAKQTFGSGGPTKVDADTWKHILCSKSYGKLSDELAEEIALIARRLCIEEVPYHHVNLLFDCRLVALKKTDNGVRPVGIGETLRRIIGKSVARITGNDIQTAGGTLQTCTGVKAGIEAAIHAMSRTWQDDSCEAVLLVDADNAFNSLNREVALHNIGRSCPSLHRYVQNSYQEPAKLHLGDGTFLLSQEGATQGDNLAMGIYAISSRSLIAELKLVVPDVTQVWFADDSSGAGLIERLKGWWSQLKVLGPSYGYHPKASKTYLILKDPSMLERAQELFAGEGVQITVEGERHIGAALGSENFKVQYVNRKVAKWVQDVVELATIAKDEPQSALSAYNTGLSQRWTFLQRTVQGISELFTPLEEAIRDQLIPSLVGRQVSEVERRLLALPYRHGGLGIRNPVLSANTEYLASVRVTAQLTDLICEQDMDLSKLDKERVKETKKEIRSEREQAFKQEVEFISTAMDEQAKKLFVCAREKGASAWLSALPLKRLGYILNKQEFRDAICLRYGWQIPETPAFCGCGVKNSFDHILTCKKGGYVSMRHNAIRDVEAKLLKEVCTDVKVEPVLIPTDGEQRTGNTALRARLDVSARGLWSRYERTFLDVRVTHPTAQSHLQKSMEQLYKENEREKKALYNDRVINTERGTFTPLVFSTTGGMAPECTRMNKRLAELIATKKGEAYSHVMQHVRTRLRFALLRCTLVAIRGSRGKVFRPEEEADISEISFNLVSQGQYE